MKTLVAVGVEENEDWKAVLYTPSAVKITGGEDSSMVCLL
jgi:hypothetical protein